MKRFFRKILVMTVSVMVLFFILVLINYHFVGNQYKFSYQASLLDKIERLESIEGPKLILIGHSNLAFGMDSEMLEKAIGMPVVNLGLHGGLGNAFHEEIAKPYIRKGDIVIICHSFFADDGSIEDPSLAWITVDNNIKLWRIISIRDYWNMIKAYPKYFRDSLYMKITGTGNQDSGGSYSRNAFNKYGDVVVKPEEGRMDPEVFFGDTESNNVEVPRIGDTCVRRLNDLNEFITARGATMLVAAYPIAYGEYSSFDRSDFYRFKNDLDISLDCDVISDYTDYFFGYDLFYDTKLHLTAEGTYKRTKQLIEDLESWKSQLQG